ncbi:response regulator [Sulfitobacter sp. MF3-043]|uniref:response regulator n=1 Tax=Sulfitobacter sediminivivens TaxID=3252902 RepID=UPI0036DD4207
MTDQINSVLLVDDDAVTNIMHKRIIERSGRARSVLVATDGEAALDIIEQHVAEGAALPELILLDINMPRMGGFEFLEQYAARGMGDSGPMIIVMLSTSLLQSDHDRAEADPNVHCFSNKLIRSELFMDLVDESLARQSPQPVASRA